MVGRMHGRVCAWQGACVAGEMATAADGTHPAGMHSCVFKGFNNSKKQECLPALCRTSKLY